MKLKLQNVRLSFPSLFRKAVFNGEETKYEGTFLISKESQADLIKEVQKAIADKIKIDLKGAKVPPEKICMKDGDYISYDGYEGHWSLKASNNRRPLVIDKDKTPLAEDDSKPYSGCYVNAMIELWAQNNAYGKRINANLLGVQFAKDGEPFGDGGVTASVDDFDEFFDDPTAEEDDNPFA